MKAKCSICKKPLSNDISICSGCGALLCGDCARSNFDTCPQCFKDVSYLS